MRAKMLWVMGLLHRHCARKENPRGEPHRRAGVFVATLAPQPYHKGGPRMVYAALLRRDPGRTKMFTDPSKLNLPPTWNALHVKRRLVQAFKIELRLNDKRIGPAIIQSAWGVIPLSDRLADNVAPDEVPGRDGWESWAREASGATAGEVSRMIEALNWPGAIFARPRRPRAGSGAAPSRVGILRGQRAQRRRAAALARLVACDVRENVGRGAERIAERLNAIAVPVT